MQEIHTVCRCSHMPLNFISTQFLRRWEGSYKCTGLSKGCLLVWVSENRCRWNYSGTARSSWGSEQVSANESTRGARGISNCSLWERMLPEVINQRRGRISRLSAAQQACLYWRKWHSTDYHKCPVCHSHTRTLITLKEEQACVQLQFQNNYCS